MPLRCQAARRTRQSSEQLPWMLVFKKAMRRGTHVPSPLSNAFAGRVRFLGGLDGVAASVGGLDKLRASLTNVLGRRYETSSVDSAVENLFIKCDRNGHVYQYGVVVFVSPAAMTAFLESLQAGDTVWRRFRVQSNTFCTITVHWSFPATSLHDSLGKGARGGVDAVSVVGGDHSLVIQ